MPHQSVHVRFRPQQLRAIENFRRAEADIPSKPQAIRQLVEEALAARQADLHEIKKNPGPFMSRGLFCSTSGTTRKAKLNGTSILYLRRAQQHR
jgi:hypothetical protein